MNKYPKFPLLLCWVDPELQTTTRVKTKSSPCLVAARAGKQLLDSTRRPAAAAGLARRAPAAEVRDGRVQPLRRLLQVPPLDPPHRASITLPIRCGCCALYDWRVEHSHFRCKVRRRPQRRDPVWSCQLKLHTANQKNRGILHFLAVKL